MKSRYAVGLIAMVCFLLIGSVLHVRAIEPDLFQALDLVRFSKRIEIQDVILFDLEGKEVRLHTFRGKVLLLNFWTTW